MQQSLDCITTTIEREWLAGIIVGTKKIEQRFARDPLGVQTVAD
jgi:hypothetical protein